MKKSVLSSAAEGTTAERERMRKTMALKVKKRSRRGHQGERTLEKMASHVNRDKDSEVAEVAETAREETVREMAVKEMAVMAAIEAVAEEEEGQDVVAVEMAMPNLRADMTAQEVTEKKADTTPGRARSKTKVVMARFKTGTLDRPVPSSPTSNSKTVAKTDQETLRLPETDSIRRIQVKEVRGEHSVATEVAAEAAEVEEAAVMALQPVMLLTRQSKPKIDNSEDY